MKPEKHSKKATGTPDASLSLNTFALHRLRYLFCLMKFDTLNLHSVKKLD